MEDTIQSEKTVESDGNAADLDAFSVVCSPRPIAQLMESQAPIDLGPIRLDNGPRIRRVMLEYVARDKDKLPTEADLNDLTQHWAVFINSLFVNKRPFNPLTPPQLKIAYRILEEHGSTLASEPILVTVLTPEYVILNGRFVEWTPDRSSIPAYARSILGAIRRYASTAESTHFTILGFPDVSPDTLIADMAKKVAERIRKLLPSDVPAEDVTVVPWWGIFLVRFRGTACSADLDRETLNNIILSYHDEQ